MKFIAIILCLASVVGFAQDESAVVRAEVNSLYEAAQSQDDLVASLRALPGDKKRVYIKFLRTELSAANNSTDRVVFLEALLILGDNVARDELVRDYFRDGAEGRGANQYHTLVSAGDPEIISMLAPALLLSEPYRRKGADAFSYPLSHYTASLIIDVVRNSPSFSGDVHRWAEGIPSLENASPSEDLRSIMREWWKANEGLFLVKNFKAVQPGRALTAEKVPVLASDVGDGATSPSNPMPIPSPAAESTPSSAIVSSRVGWVIAFATAAMLVIVLLRKRRA